MIKKILAKAKTVKLGWLKPLLILALLGVFLYLYKSLFVVAHVNGKLISRGELTRELEREAGRSALDALVTKNLILAEAKKKNVTASKEELDAEIAKIEESIKATGQTLEDALAFQGWTKQDLVDQVRVQKLAEKLLAAEVVVTDEEIDAYIAENNPETGRDEVRQMLEGQKFSEKFSEWINKVRQEAKINFFVDF